MPAMTDPYQSRHLIPSFSLSVDLLNYYFSGDIAIDDILIAPGACSNVPVFSDPTSLQLETVGCSFDSPTSCTTWTNSNWTVSNDTTPSANTGPALDHTGNGGYYLFAESSQPYQIGDTAMLSSVMLPPTQSFSNSKKSAGVCVEFW